MTFTLAGACASGGVGRRAERDIAESAVEAGEAPSRVMVNNQSGNRVTVFISQGSETWRLGEVEPYSRRSLSLHSVGEALRDREAFLIARPIAGSPFRSETFSLSPEGGMPTWTIASYTASSYVSLHRSAIHPD